MSEREYVRRAARVLLMDGAERLLLFRARVLESDDPAAVCWFTPGGGIEDGETLAQAAARELREETGLTVPPEALGDAVAFTAGEAELAWASGWFRDDFFWLRIDAHDVDVSGFQDDEAAVITGHRWWSLPALRTTPELVYPFGLAPLLDDLLAGRLPAEPTALPWHH